MAAASSRKPVSRARAAAAHSTKAATPKAGGKAAPKPAPKAAKPAARSPKPIELHFWPTPNGQKVAILLEECGLRYEMKPVNIGRGEQFSAEFLSLSPNSRIPAIVDPDGPNGKPLSVFESGAILQYLGRKTGKFYPPEGRGRVEVDEWLFWQMAGLGPMAGQANHFRQFAPETVPYAIERYTNEVARLYDVMNKRLADREFLAGKFSIADMACYPWIVPHQLQGQNLANFPHLNAWFERLSARPGLQRGMNLGKELRVVQTDLRASQNARRVLLGHRVR